MIGFKFKIFFIFHSQYSTDDSLWNIEVDFDEMELKGKGFVVCY